MELIAHRAGNSPRSVAVAPSEADAIELDVHQFRRRLEVRHSKALWPLAVYWERGEGVVRDECPPDLDAILAVTPIDRGLWIDLKGFSSRFTRRVLRLVGDRPAVTMSCRSWWALRPAEQASGVRTFRSVGNRWQLWLALRLRHPDGVAVHERFAGRANLERLDGRCRAVAAWGVHDAERARALERAGVEVLIVDDHDLIRTLRDRR